MSTTVAPAAITAVGSVHSLSQASGVWPSIVATAALPRAGIVRASNSRTIYVVAGGIDTPEYLDDSLEPTFVKPYVKRNADGSTPGKPVWGDMEADHPVGTVMPTEVYEDPGAIGDPSTSAAGDHKHPAGPLTAWRGDWVQNTYRKNDIVRDGDWLMAANKDTDERAGPQPIGAPFWGGAGSVMAPLTTTVSATQAIGGWRLTPASGGYLTGLRWHPDMLLDPNLKYDIYVISDPLGDAVIRFTLLDLQHNGVAEWQDVEGLPTGTILAGETMDLFIVVTNTGDATQTVANYDYQMPNNEAVPLSGQIVHANKLTDTMRIHKTDDDGSDRTAVLSSLKEGDQLNLTGQDWTINGPPVDEGTYYSVPVNPSAQGGPAGVHAVAFNVYGATTFDFVRHDDYWASKPNVQGFTGGSYSDITLNEHLYGIDMEFQNASIPLDWDLMAQSGGGGGGGGTPGTPGSTWHVGSGVPTVLIGIDGDFYLDDVNGDVYQKVAGAWVLESNIMGPEGPEGPEGTPGTTLHDGLTDVTPDQHHPRLHDHSDVLDEVHINPQTVAQTGGQGFYDASVGAQHDDVPWPGSATQKSLVIYGHTQAITITGVQQAYRPGQQVALVNNEPYPITLPFRSSSSAGPNTFFGPNLQAYQLEAWGNVELVAVPTLSGGWDWLIRPATGRASASEAPVVQAFGDTPDHDAVSPSFAAARHVHGMPDDPVPAHETAYDHANLGGGPFLPLAGGTMLGSILVDATDAHDMGEPDKRIHEFYGTRMDIGAPNVLGPIGANLLAEGNGAYPFVVWGIPADTTYGAAMYLVSARGTPMAPAPLLSGDYVGAIMFGGLDAAGSPKQGATIFGQLTGDPDAGTSFPTRLLFSTSAASDAANVGRWEMADVGHWLPIADAAYDFGAAALRIRDGYFSGKVYAPAVESDAAPLRLNSINHGLYLSPVGADYFADAAGFRPLATGKSLGGSTQPWLNGFFSGTIVAAAVNPAADATGSLGADGLRWGTVWTGTLRSTGWLNFVAGSKMTFSVTDVVRANINTVAFYPESDGVFDIGGPSPNQFRDGYFSGQVYASGLQSIGALYLTSTGNIYVTGSMSGADATYSIGTATRRWKDGYFSGTVWTPNVRASSGHLRIRNDDLEIILQPANAAIDWRFGASAMHAVGADIGTDAAKFKDGHFSGTVYAGTVSVTNVAAVAATELTFWPENALRYKMSKTAFYPYYISTSDLGKVGNEWKDAYFSGIVNAASGVLEGDGSAPYLTFRTTAAPVAYTKQGSVTFGYDGTGTFAQVEGEPVTGFDVGSNDYYGMLALKATRDGSQWPSGGVEVLHTQVRPASDATVSFGASWRRFTDAHFSGTVNASNVVATGASSTLVNLYPSADITNDMGIGSSRWRRVYTQRVYTASWFSEAATESVYLNSGGLYSNADAALDLGRVDKRWKDGHFSGTVYAGSIKASSAKTTGWTDWPGEVGVFDYVDVDVDVTADWQPSLVRLDLNGVDPAGQAIVIRSLDFSAMENYEFCWFVIRNNSRHTITLPHDDPADTTTPFLTADKTDMTLVSYGGSAMACYANDVIHLYQ